MFFRAMNAINVHFTFNLYFKLILHAVTVLRYYMIRKTSVT